MKKKLVYHIHWDCGPENEKVYKLHSLLLSKYKDIFDEYIICIATKKENDKTQRLEALKWINEIFYDKQIIVKFVENSQLRESDTFKREIIDKLDTTDSIVFFGHTKGTTNVLNPDINVESVYRWICACYYFSLEFMDEVEYNFFNTIRANMFYGSLLQDFKKSQWDLTYWYNEKNDPFYIYIGTFYWLNCNLLSEYKRNGLITLPKCCDRFYAEQFPAYVCPGIIQEYFFQSHKNVATVDFDFYSMNKEEWINVSEVLGEPSFIDFSDKIINEL